MTIAVPIAIAVALATSLYGQAGRVWPNYQTEQESEKDKAEKEWKEAKEKAEKKWKEQKEKAEKEWKEKAEKQKKKEKEKPEKGDDKSSGKDKSSRADDFLPKNKHGKSDKSSVAEASKDRRDPLTKRE